jgi:integrase
MARPNKPWFHSVKGFWYATVGGKRVSLGVKGRENEAEAVKTWHRLMAGLTKEKTKPKAEATTGEVLTAFLADCEGRVMTNTLRVYRYFLLPFARRHGKGKASDLTPTLAEAYVRKPEWSEATRNDCLGSLATAFRWAVRARMLPANPLAGVKAPAKPSRGSRSLISPEEHARLMALASPTFRNVLFALHESGARPGEATSVTADDFNAERGVWLLARHKTAHKTGKARIVYLTPELASLCEELARKHPEGPLFRTCHGKPWEKSKLVREMIRLRRRAGVPHATLYGYRHGFATDALANGVPDAQVAELLGHSGTTMLHRHYAHLGARAKALRDALGRVRWGSAFTENTPHPPLACRGRGLGGRE